MAVAAELPTTSKKTRNEGERFALRLELVNLTLVAVAFVIAHLAFGVGPTMWGALVGGLIGALNLRAMVFLGKRILHGPRQARAIYTILFALKLGAICTLVWLALAHLPIDAIGFLIGFSTLLPAMLVTAALKILDTPDTDTASKERR